MSKITKEQIESRIKDKAFLVHDTLTICIITLDNGFKETGFSSCVDPANFNKELGEKYAYEDAFSKLWKPFGFNLIEQEESLYKSAVHLVHEKEKVCNVLLQRNLQVGYNKASSLIERMEREKVVSEMDEHGKRHVFGWGGLNLD